ncbi:hypothetical protein O1L44_30090 [Streptomyces noursei]|nr:hypothetical protein [Streptomyces noursei]
MSIPVVRAETFYLPSHPQRPDAWALIAPAERVFRWYEDRVQRRVRLPDGFVIGQKAFARINHNRWVADCPCGSAQVVTRLTPDGVHRVRLRLARPHLPRGHGRRRGERGR